MPVPPLTATVISAVGVAQLLLLVSVADAVIRAVVLKVIVVIQPLASVILTVCDTIGVTSNSKAWLEIVHWIGAAAEPSKL